MARKNGVEVEGEDIHGGCESYVNPYKSSQRILKAIESAETTSRIAKRGKSKSKKLFTDVEVGDIVIVFDEYAHDYTQHRIKVEGIEYDSEHITDGNPRGMVCYGIDLDEEEFGDDAITVATIANFCHIETTITRKQENNNA